MSERREAAGFTMIELMIAVAVIAVMIAGAASSLTTSWRQNQLLREEAAALRHAEAKLAEIRGQTLANIVTSYGANYSFRAQLLRGQTGSMGLLVSNVPVDEGEVVLILDETPAEAGYGRDLDVTTGPDGVDLNGDGYATGVLSSSGSGSLFPLDLDGDGDTDADAVPAADLKLLPVVVIIRWRSLTGGPPKLRERRVQLMTVIGGP